MDEYLPDQKLAQVHKDGFEAIKGEDQPDHPTRHKYLETAYKLKARRPTMDQEHASSIAKPVRVPWNKGKLVGAKPPLALAGAMGLGSAAKIAAKCAPGCLGRICATLQAASRSSA